VTAVRRQLPAPRHPGRYRLVLVCLGNICRSAMADVVLTGLVEDAGLADRVEVASAGTGDWHVGGPMDRRAAALLTSHGYDASRHEAQQFEAAWHEEYDAVLAMDATNRADLAALAEQPGGQDLDRLLMFRDLDPLATDDDRDVADPYYGEDEGFEETLAVVRRTGVEIVRELERLLA
jgi:protein-tyrosine phosphatase